MDIKYVKINENRVKAIGILDGKYPEKVNDVIADELIRLNYLHEKDLKINKKLVAFATISEPDTYDFETGKKVARDKLLIKFNEEMERIYDNYKDALKKYTKYISYCEDVAEEKVKRAKERYDKY